ncbi:hypothetical protein X759_11430 [Mesorhizobium sp. LSHC420B00]|jgi:hypothetical protein|nr:hypothetical protein X759_11430 [Mesorhizobium sp. LSHC420B00]
MFRWILVFYALTDNVFITTLKTQYDLTVLRQLIAPAASDKMRAMIAVWQSGSGTKLYVFCSSLDGLVRRL